MTQSPDYKAKYGAWALVIGASEGLGEALARDCARRGMNVAMVARREDKLRATAARVAADFGVETLPIPADLLSPNVLETLLTGLGGREVGFLIYNAAGENGGEFLHQDIERHLANIQINCVAPTIVAHHFARGMVQRGRGGVVICSSFAAMNGLYNWVSYGASKAYERILGEGLWYELKDDGVGATTLMIGSTYTPNFQASQRSRGAAFAETRTPDNLPPGTPIPQAPEEASFYLFDQIDKEWIPLVYANPRDEANLLQTKDMPLDERIVRSSDPTRASWIAGGRVAGREGLTAPAE